MRKRLAEGGSARASDPPPCARQWRASRPAPGASAMSGPGVHHNRLAALAGDIRQASAAIQQSAIDAATKMIGAGQALIEAKGLLAHGEWLQWLREHCAMSERTA